MNCPHCQTDAAPQQSYCRGCGRSLPQQPPEGSELQQQKRQLTSAFAAHKRRLGLNPTQPALASAIGKLNDIVALDLGVAVKTLPFVSYALQHAGIGVVAEIKIHNASHEPSQNLMIDIHLSPGDYGEAWSSNIPSLAPGETWSRQNIRLPLHRDRLRSVAESEHAALHISVSDRHERLWVKTDEIEVLPYNHWLFLPEFMQLLAAYVQPNDPAIHPVIEAAAKRQQADSGSSSFPGYQTDDPDKVVAMLNAIHQTLADEINIDYINPPPSFEKSGQKIRLAADTLKQRRGTCLDLSVLQAALWEHVACTPQSSSYPDTHSWLADYMSIIQKRW